MTKNHSHAWYRIGATRVFTGSKKVKPQLSIKLKEVLLLFISFILFFLIRFTFCLCRFTMQSTNIQTLKI